ncbi:MAG: thioredoxin domain-containing protein [Spirochaetaceae bacterium]|nr:MAG: thioredoxin domain-containing protein [Spirochaetaceae bacterium]
MILTGLSRSISKCTPQHGPAQRGKRNCRCGPVGTVLFSLLTSRHRSDEFLPVNTPDFSRNNLDRTASPYLRQHEDNPVWWQPWTREVLEYAKERDKPLFVSVGYATCHWCHVMASEAFSDPGVADKLNRDFVSIKVDREERPDLDHYLMQFLLATRGSGGWPLNAFLTPEGKPFLALTYVPVKPRQGMPGFPEILERVTEFYRSEAHRVSDFALPFGYGGSGKRSTPAVGSPIAPDEIAPAAVHRAHNLVRREDRIHGGFGTGAGAGAGADPGPKFPPHSALLYLLHVLELYRDDVVEETVRRTLDAIARRGLHDHLQGGFFRYCVDVAWTIPHFEKMLYDQAMLLWVYSLAWKVLGRPWYREVAAGIVRALDETFADPDGLLISAHDADTDHQEGLTYLWSDGEIASLGADEREHLLSLFEIVEGGNLEGRHHLVRRDDGPLESADLELLERMLERRRARPQPGRDDKIVTAWNALAAIALVHAGRYLDEPTLVERARAIYRALETRNRLEDGRWIRSSREGRRNTVECLEDYAALLYLTTMLAEHAPSEEKFEDWVPVMMELEARIDAFRHEGGWLYSLAEDIPPVPADTFDSPTPSPKALAEAALIRSALLRGAPPPPPVPLGPDYQEDFHNLAVLMQEGEFYLLEGAELLPWRELPANGMQRMSPRETWCFRGICRPGRPEEWNPPAY